MRTIEFRGIIKNPDELFSGFIYGDLLHYANGSIGIRQIETGQEFDVVPETVGQFTGLYDKNGKEIFEGDGFGNKNMPNRYVVFEDGKYCFNKVHSHGADVLSQDRVGRLEIIGNIFNNPELLKN